MGYCFHAWCHSSYMKVNRSSESKLCELVERTLQYNQHIIQPLNLFNFIASLSQDWVNKESRIMCLQGILRVGCVLLIHRSLSFFVRGTSAGGVLVCKAFVLRCCERFYRLCFVFSPSSKIKPHRQIRSNTLCCVQNQNQIFIMTVDQC